MTFPAIPFVTGILVGTLTTFLYMDKGSKKKFRSGAAAAAGKVSDGALKVKRAVEPKAEEPDANSEEIEETTPKESVKTARKPTAQATEAK